MTINEYYVMENGGIGSHLLHEFACQHEKSHDLADGPELPYAFIVLPLCFRRSVVQNIHNRNLGRASLFKAIKDDRAIFSDLHDRMIEYSDQTFRALHICFSSNLIIYDQATLQLIPKRKGSIMRSSSLSREYQNMVLAARRIGAWTALFEEEEILHYLKIHF